MMSRGAFVYFCTKVRSYSSSFMMTLIQAYARYVSEPGRTPTKWSALAASGCSNSGSMTMSFAPRSRLRPIWPDVYVASVHTELHPQNTMQSA